MENTELQSEVRALLTQADHLSRVAYAAHRERDAEVFASLRTTLQRIDRLLGVSAVHPAIPGQLDVLYQRVRDVAARTSGEAREAMNDFVEGAERVHESVAPPKLLVQKLPAFLRLLD